MRNCLVILPRTFIYVFLVVCVLFIAQNYLPRQPNAFFLVIVKIIRAFFVMILMSDSFAFPVMWSSLKIFLSSHWNQIFPFMMCRPLHDVSFLPHFLEQQLHLASKKVYVQRQHVQQTIITPQTDPSPSPAPSSSGTLSPSLPQLRLPTRITEPPNRFGSVLVFLLCLLL